MSERSAASSPVGPSRPLRGRLVPPAPAPGTVRRPRLETRLDDGAARRLTTVVAGAGYGKSTLVAAWAADRPDVAWYTLAPEDRHLPTFLAGLADALARVVEVPLELATLAEHVGSIGGTGPLASDEAERIDALAGFVCAALDEPLAVRSVVLVLDDLHEVEDGAAVVRVIERLVRGAPPLLHLVIASRQSLPFGLHRLRGQGQVVDITADPLALTNEEIGQLLEGDPGAAALAPRIAELTAGWPVAVRLVVDQLRDAAPDRRDAVLERLRRPDGPLFGYLAGEVLAGEPAPVVDVLRIAACFDRVDADLLAAAGLSDAGTILADLAERASFVQRVGGERDYALHALIAEFVRTARPLTDEETRRVQSIAAERLEADGRIEEALDAWLRSDDRVGLRAFVERSVDALRTTGAMGRLPRLAEAVPPPERTPAVEILLGDGAMAAGDHQAALESYRRAGADAPSVAPALASRVAMYYHEQGDVAATFDILDRVDPAAGEPAEAAMCSAVRAIASWTAMDPEIARPHAERALTLARESGDDRALAAAYEAAAIVANIDGDAPAAERLFRLGVEHAARAGDPLLEARTRTDLGYQLHDEGRFAEARDELELAVRLASTIGQSTYHALALCDLVVALTGLGRFDEALADVRLARAIYERHDSAWVAYALAREGTIHRLRGDVPAAVAAFRQGIAAGEELRHQHVLADLRTGLAETIVGEDPDEARALIEAQIEDHLVFLPLAVHLSMARVRIALGEREGAIAEVGEIARLARPRRNRVVLAMALETLALAGDEPLARRLRFVDEAAAIWRSIQAPYWSAGNLATRAQVLGGSEGRAAALEAEQRFRALGARGAADDAAGLARSLELEAAPQVVIQALGRFRVVRNGVPVTPSAWQSRKARDLLKYLVARRGRPTTREALAEALWPDEDPGPLANRLSVALTTVRTVLDPDKRHSPEWFIQADKMSVALDLEHVSVDLESFLADAERGLRLAGQRGAEDQALVHLLAADAAYAGDFLDEDPDEPWAIVLREEARDLAVSVSRALADLAVRRGDGAGAVRHLLQVLERDPYDEPAHLRLVATLAGDGRHGEARRRYGMYVQRMDEIGVEAAAFPGPEGQSLAAVGLRAGAGSIGFASAGG